jgi:aminoglycoside phosphotransferase (APT) family kinase protein
MQYRPGSDLVARFRVEVSWHGGQPTKDTLVAATTKAGPPLGTVPVTADTPAGSISVGVWRWPFDPALPALADAVRESGLRRLLHDVGLLSDSVPVNIEVVAYRPIERAVLRIRNGEQTFYVKIVRPERASLMLYRYEHLRSHGLPVPTVIAADADQGWILLEELDGPTLRELIKSDAPKWVEPGRFRGMVQDLAACDPAGLPAVRSRILDAPIHAAILATVLPSERLRLEHFGALMTAALDASIQRPPKVIHGDLHEGQIVIGQGRIAGLLDIDDVGPGDPIDDVIVPVGHLRYRASVSSRNANRITALADDLLMAFASDYSRADLAIGVSAVLIGVATSPFRQQQPDWPTSVARVLDLVERTLD